MEQFVQRVKRNRTLTELTPYALRELVKAVYVEAPDKSSGKRRQGTFRYDLVGFIPVDELLKAERRDRSHAVPEKIRYYFLMTPDHFLRGLLSISFYPGRSLLEQPFFPVTSALSTDPVEREEMPAALPRWTSAKADCDQRQSGWNGIRRICGTGGQPPLSGFTHPHSNRVHNAAATGRPIPGNMVEMDAGQAKRAMIAVTAAGILANNQRAAHLTDKTAFAYSAGFFFFFILKTIHLTSYPPKVINHLRRPCKN